MKGDTLAGHKNALTQSPKPKDKKTNTKNEVSFKDGLLDTISNKCSKSMRYKQSAPLGNDIPLESSKNKYIVNNKTGNEKSINAKKPKHDYKKVNATIHQANVKLEIKPHNTEFFHGGPCSDADPCAKAREGACKCSKIPDSTHCGNGKRPAPENITTKNQNSKQKHNVNNKSENEKSANIEKPKHDYTNNNAALHQAFLKLEIKPHNLVILRDSEKGKPAAENIAQNLENIPDSSTRKQKNKVTSLVHDPKQNKNSAEIENVFAEGPCHQGSIDKQCVCTKPRKKKDLSNASKAIDSNTTIGKLRNKFYCLCRKYSEKLKNKRCGTDGNLPKADRLHKAALKKQRKLIKCCAKCLCTHETTAEPENDNIKNKPDNKQKSNKPKETDQKKEHNKQKNNKQDSDQKKELVLEKPKSDLQKEKMKKPDTFKGIFLKNQKHASKGEQHTSKPLGEPLDTKKLTGAKESRGKTCGEEHLSKTLKEPLDTKKPTGAKESQGKTPSELKKKNQKYITFGDGEEHVSKTLKEPLDTKKPTGAKESQGKTPSELKKNNQKYITCGDGEEHVSKTLKEPLDTKKPTGAKESQGKTPSELKKKNQKYFRCGEEHVSKTLKEPLDSKELTGAKESQEKTTSESKKKDLKNTSKGEQRLSKTKKPLDKKKPTGAKECQGKTPSELKKIKKGGASGIDEQDKRVCYCKYCKSKIKAQPKSSTIITCTTCTKDSICTSCTSCLKNSKGNKRIKDTKGKKGIKNIKSTESSKSKCVSTTKSSQSTVSTTGTTVTKSTKGTKCGDASCGKHIQYASSCKICCKCNSMIDKYQTLFHSSFGNFRRKLQKLAAENDKKQKGRKNKQNKTKQGKGKKNKIKIKKKKVKVKVPKVDKKKINLKRKQQEKQRLKELAGDAKFMKEAKRKEAADRKKQLKANKQELRDLEKLNKGEEELQETSCLSEFALSVLKTAWRIAKTCVFVVFRLITRPKSSLRYIQARATDPMGTFERISKWSRGELYKKKLEMTKAAAGSETMSILSDTLKDQGWYQLAFAEKGKSNADRRRIALENRKRKRRILKRRNEALYSCKNNLLNTLRKTPCLWVYHVCPGFYPQCLSMLAFWSKFSNMMLFCLAFAVWTPCIVACELCRGLMCCSLCMD